MVKGQTINVTLIFTGSGGTVVLTVNSLQYLKLALAVSEIKMYHQSVTITHGPLRNRQPVAWFTEGRSDCPWRPTEHWGQWDLLGEPVPKCSPESTVRFLACVWFPVCIPWSSLSRSQFYHKVRKEGRQTGVKERRTCKINWESVLDPSGPELGAWRGSHSMHVSDSSLSHYSSWQFPPPPVQIPLIAVAFLFLQFAQGATRCSWLPHHPLWGLDRQCQLCK